MAMEVFALSKRFPKDELYSLTDQIRRSSRSVPANIAEAWRKRRYPAAFVAKLNDAEGEAAETQTHLEIALRCGYLDSSLVVSLDKAASEELLRVAETPAAYGSPLPSDSSPFTLYPTPDAALTAIIRLRELHAAMDRAVLDAYGWTDIPTDCEFILDYEDEGGEDGETGGAGDGGTVVRQGDNGMGGWGDSVSLGRGDGTTSPSHPVSPSPSLFVSPSPHLPLSPSPSRRRRRLPWRYRWPDPIRDEVLARLLALNAERAEEERLAGEATEKTKTFKAGRTTNTKTAHSSHLELEL